MGTMVGGYEIIKELGEGGMGTVLLAERRRLHRPGAASCAMFAPWIYKVAIAAR